MEKDKSFDQIRSTRYPMMEASPHLLTKEKTSNIMQLVVLALLPSILASILFFGLRSLLLYLLAISTCLVSEYLWYRVRKKTTPNDFSAVVTGVLLAMSLPASVPLWYPVLGGAVGIILAKELFGGIGRNLLNPALAGRAVLRLVFVKEMSANVQPQLPFSIGGIDVVSSATPLMSAKAGETLTSNQMIDSLTGLIAGKNAETASVLLLLGAVFLLYKKVITWHIPMSLLGTVLVLSFFISGGEWTYLFAQVFGGATLLGAFYMATDYSTSPTTSYGQIIYGILCGCSLVAWRLFTSMPEGMTFVLLLMNLFVPLIDYLIIPRAYGINRSAEKE